MFEVGWGSRREVSEFQDLSEVCRKTETKPLRTEQEVTGYREPGLGKFRYGFGITTRISPNSKVVFSS